MDSELTELCVVLIVDISEVASRDQLHHNVDLLRRLVDCVQLGHVVVLDAEHRVQLVFQLQECLFLAILLDDFDGTWQLSLVFNCSLDFAKLATAESTRKSVAFLDVLYPIYFVNLVILFLEFPHEALYLLTLF